MSDETAGQSPAPPASDSSSDPEPATGHAGRSLGWLGLRRPPAFAASFALLARSRATFDLARQVSRASACPEDGAQLLRKAIFLLFAAVLRLEQSSGAGGFAECRRRIQASKEARELFGEVLDELSFLDELLSSYPLIEEDRAGIGERYEHLLQRLPRLHRAVNQHLNARFRAAGGRPGLRLALAAAALLGVVALGVSLLLQRAGAGGPIETAAGEQARAPGDTQPDDRSLLEQPGRCFVATYFSDPAFETVVATRRDCRIEFDWGEAGPAGLPQVPPDNFSVRWQGMLRVPADGAYTFYLASDDGSRLYLERSLIIDNWGAHGLAEKVSRAIQLRTGVDYPMRVDFQEGDGLAQVRLAWSSADLSKRPLTGEFVWRDPVDGGAPVVRPEAPDDPLADPTRCFVASYFNGREFDELVESRRECRIDHDWGESAPDGVAGLGADDFSVRWEGSLQVPETGAYTFTLGSDDGSRLFVAGRHIAGEWAPHGYGESDSEPIELEAGVDYPIRVEFFEAGDVAMVRLLWKSATMPRVLLSGKYVAAPGRSQADGPPDAAVSRPAD